MRHIDERVEDVIDRFRALTVQDDGALRSILRDVMDLVRADAVASERMRCHSIAKKIGDEVYVGPGGDCAQGCQGIAEEIAKSIISS